MGKTFLFLCHLWPIKCGCLWSWWEAWGGSGRKTCYTLLEVSRNISNFLESLADCESFKVELYKQNGLLGKVIYRVYNKKNKKKIILLHYATQEGSDWVSLNLVHKAKWSPGFQGKNSGPFITHFTAYLLKILLSSVGGGAMVYLFTLLSCSLWPTEGSKRRLRPPFSTKTHNWNTTSFSKMWFWSMNLPEWVNDGGGGQVRLLVWWGWSRSSSGGCDWRAILFSSVLRSGVQFCSCQMVQCLNTTFTIVK